MSERDVERALERLLFENSGMSRRRFLGRSGAAALGLTALGSALAGCSIEGEAAHSVNAAKAVAHPYVHHKTRRVCSTVRSAHRMTCFAIRQTDTVQPKAFSAKAVVPNAVPSGYGPTNLASAYKLSSAGGSGATVAIVDAYNDPSAAADLAIYRSQYGLPACTVANGCLRIVNQNGATSPLPADDPGWAGEESLDLDMVSAVCPNCHIILVEANSASDANLYAAEDRAVKPNQGNAGETDDRTRSDRDVRRACRVVHRRPRMTQTTIPSALSRNSTVTTM